MSPKSNNLSLVAIIALVILIAAVGILVLNNSSLKKELNKKKTELLELEKVNTELDQNYESALQDLEELRSDNQELNDLIDSQKEELTKQKNRISTLIWTERELGKARSEMDKLNALAQEYMEELNTLRKSNASLLEENSELSTQNKNLSSEIKLNRTKMTEMDSVSRILKNQSEKLKESNQRLSSKVDMANAIKINYINIKTLDDRGKGKVKERSRAKRVDILRTCFTTETNLVTPSGGKEFYVRFTNPAGEVLYVEELGSGKLTNKLTGETIKYSTSGIVEYNHEELQACIDWTPNFGLSSGNYTVEIFENGYNVGKGTFRLK